MKTTEGFTQEIKKHAVDLGTLGAIIGVILSYKNPEKTKQILGKVIGKSGAKHVPEVFAGALGGGAAGKLIQAVVGRENPPIMRPGSSVRVVENVYGDQSYDPRF